MEAPVLFLTVSLFMTEPNRRVRWCAARGAGAASELLVVSARVPNSWAFVAPAGLGVSGKFSYCSTHATRQSFYNHALPTKHSKLPLSHCKVVVCHVRFLHVGQVTRSSGLT